MGSECCGRHLVGLGNQTPKLEILYDGASSWCLHSESMLRTACFQEEWGGWRMNSQGEIEAAVCQGMTRFEQEYMGRGPKDIRAHLIGDLLIVRLQGVLTAAEQHLVKTLPSEKGRDLLKQVRSQLIEVARPALEQLVQDITGTKPRSLHHDISTLTGEEIVVFTLESSPLLRETKKR